MPKFPKKEAEIIALADLMAKGYQLHAGDFPSVILGLLVVNRHHFRTARENQRQARAAVRLATEAKNNSLARLKELMKNYLRKSAVDVADDVEKLAYIGWAPKAQPQPIEAPAAPQNLRSIAEGQGLLRLEWESSASGGAVRNYIIERRQQETGGGDFGPWTIVGSSLNNEIDLIGQPRGAELEYRVKAVNTTGESVPSNTVAVVL